MTAPNGDLYLAYGDRVTRLRRRERPVALAPNQHDVDQLEFDGCGRLWSAGETVHVLENGVWLHVAQAPAHSRVKWTDSARLPTGVALADSTKVVRIERACP